MISKELLLSILKGKGNNPNKVKIECYALEVEDSVLSQLLDTAKLPFLKELAIMPDCHAGAGIPVGVALKFDDNHICPPAVGVDIGCGVSAYKTKYTADQIRPHLEQIKKLLEAMIPVNANLHEKPFNWAYPKMTKIGEKIYGEKNANRALGTLGGGNHFVEIGVGEDGYVWGIVHSGSRGFGHGVGVHYQKVCAANSNNPRVGEMVVVSVDSPEGQDYLQDLNVCLEYALQNRLLMTNAILQAIHMAVENTGVAPNFLNQISKLPEPLFINRNHNHAVFENGGWVIRKGATHAAKDMYGVLPINMAHGTYIVKGIGNEDALRSAPHGAGRRMSRKAARSLDVATHINDMAGIVCDSPAESIDECQAAYKDPDLILSSINELMTISERIVPLLNQKGTKGIAYGKKGVSDCE